MNIAIFGAGIAGLMSAITLRAQGQSCRVYERSSLAQEAGMGFILVPEGIDALERFGVHLAGDVSGTPLKRYHCCDSAGRIVYEQAMPAGSRGIRRRDLTMALMRALDGGEAVVFADFEGLDVGEDFHVTGAHLRLHGDSIAVIADLYVGAEGVNSRTRHAIFPDWPVTPDQVPEFVGLVRCDRAAKWAGNNLNKFHAAEGGIAFGILPVDEEHVVWYLQFDSQRFPLTADVMHGDPQVLAGARRRFVEGLVGAWAHPIPSLVAHTDFSRVHLWRPIETDLIPRFHRGNVVLIGDAAHPLSPFTSQGVSSAVADAIALAEEVDGAGSQEDLMQGLERYSARRHAQCAPYVAQGRELVQRFLEPLSEDNAVLPIATRSDEAPVLTRATQRSAFAQEA
jgi:2-polyprenyl-6-methoxyphenol hydroxylase-like FAD-dependent oxidoreductase